MCAFSDDKDISKPRLKSLPNTRGLGGIPAGNKVIGRRLIRSGSLHKATTKDCQFLTGTLEVKTIIDLRTELERLLDPDPCIPGTENIHLPLLSMGTVERISVQEGLEAGLKDVLERGPEIVESLYVAALTGSLAIKNLARFFDILAGQEKGSVLWHCSQGKDRTGLCAALLEYVLGADREHIVCDYLQTNPYLDFEEENMEKRLQELTKRPHALWADLSCLYEARPEFLRAAFTAVEEQFGSLDNYLKNQLHVSQKKKERLQTLYLV